MTPATGAPRVLKTSGPAGLLRAVPALVPVPVDDSLVLVLFGGTRSRGAIRFDLAHGLGDRELERWADRLLGTAVKVEGVDGVVPVAYTPETFAPGGRVPAARVLRAVSRRADRMGLGVLDLLCVAPDGWGSLHDPELRRGGAPLSEIGEPEPARRRADGEPAAAASPAALDAFDLAFEQWWTRPEGPGGVLHGVVLDRTGAAFGVVREPAMQRYRHGVDQDDVVELVERMLDPHDPAASPCPCRALLAAIGMRQGLDNLLLLQIGWGREAGAAAWRAAHGMETDSPALAEMAAAVGGGAIRRPDVARIDAAIAAVAEVASLVPAELSHVPDGLLAWLHWSLGASSTGARCAERALQRDPGRDLPSIVLARTQAGVLPEWAFREDPTAPDPWDPAARAAERASAEPQGGAA